MLNVLDLIFLNLAFTVSIVGFLVNNFEKNLPAFIIKGFKYGSFAYQGSEANFLQVIEVPKSYYRHFYLFSSIFSTVAWLYMFLVYYANFTVIKYTGEVLNLILQQDVPSVTASAAFIAMGLLTIQCIRRFYETYYLQVFAKSSKMNLSHYLAGIIHYFACVVAIIGEAPLFCGDENRESIVWTDFRTNMFVMPCMFLFLWAWHQQYQANVTFANLRKDKKSGQVVTEEHGIPHGGLFEHISSPHRLCEVMIYTVLVILIPTKTFFCIYAWVLSNQIQTAIQAHQWYKKTFPNYPQNRAAIFPKLL